MIDFLKNKFLYSDKYKTNSEAVVVSCFFNPQNSPYRTRAFQIFYDSIKHLNHQIIECVIGNSTPQLTGIKNLKVVYTQSLLWHKETLLNKVISELPKKYKYVFWLDADIIFTNKNWLVDGVKELQNKNIIQPFEYCVHLEKDELVPTMEFPLLKTKAKYTLMGNTLLNNPELLGDRTKLRVWRSFCATHATKPILNGCSDYDIHGHVGFAWGARREVLDAVPLYDKALIGGSDHIIAHAAAGQIPHSCIQKSFSEDIEAVERWSKLFHCVVDGKIGYVTGDLYHIWHGDIKDRQYLKRIVDFTPTAKAITEKDVNGMYVASPKQEEYMKEYFKKREVTTPVTTNQKSVFDDLLNPLNPLSPLCPFGIYSQDNNASETTSKPMVEEPIQESHSTSDIEQSINVSDSTNYSSNFS